MTSTVSEKAEMALRMVVEAPILAYDTETSGLDWKRNYPIGYVFTTDPKTSVYVPVRHGGGGNIPGGESLRSPEASITIHPFEKKLAEAFKSRTMLNRLTVGHNLKFDCHFSLNAGVSLGRVIKCTQVREAILDEYARSYSLEASCRRRKLTAKKGEELYEYMAGVFGQPAKKDIMARYWELSGSDPMAVSYAEGDGTSTLELFLSQQPDIEAQELGMVDDLEGELIWTLMRMERNGFPVSVERVLQLKEQTEAQIEDMYASKFPEGFNPRSPLKMRQLVEDVAGRTDWPTTSLGNPSFTEKYLSTFEEGRLVVDLRRKTNLLSSFINPLLETHIFNGRVHSTINQIKSDNEGTPARLSCSAPNLQQVPKRIKEIARPFRRVFVAPEGKLIYDADWSQCEPRLFAHYSGDKALLEGYNQTPFKDVHQVVAELMNVERDPTAKRMNMGIFTGMQPVSFAGHMGWNIITAKDKWNEWFTMFPGVKNFQENAKYRLKNRGYVKTLLGRRGRLEHPRFAYRGTSKVIQGSNADIAKFKLVEIDKFCESEGDVIELMMSIHDAFEWLAPDDPKGEQMSEEIVRIMNDVQSPPFNLRVPFVAEYGKGKDWAIATFGEQLDV